MLARVEPVRDVSSEGTSEKEDTRPLALGWVQSCGGRRARLAGLGLDFSSRWAGGRPVQLHLVVLEATGGS